jgi:hypothetical protein
MNIKPVLAAFGGNKSALAKAFKVSSPAVSRWVKNGKLPALRAYQWRDMQMAKTASNAVFKP